MPTYILDGRTANNHFPGIGRYVSNLAQAMVGQLDRDEQLILLHDPRQPSRWALPAESPQLTLQPCPISPFAIGQQWTIPGRLRGGDLYHSPYYLMPYRPGRPTLVTLYDLIPHFFPATVSLQVRLFFRMAHRLAIRAATHLIAISEATRQDVMQLYGLQPSQITTIPLGVDAHFCPAPAGQIATIRQKYQLPTHYALYVGINKPHKNLLNLVKSWAKVNVPAGWQLIIAGSWDKRYPQAKEWVAANSQQANPIQFLGPIPEAELPALYSGAAFFIFPSQYEGFGLPVLEAMACGCPVACGNHSSLPEIVGQAGLLFDPSRPEQIAQTLSQLLNTPTLRANLVSKGLSQATQFQWATTAQKTIQLYRQILVS